MSPLRNVKFHPERYKALLDETLPKVIESEGEYDRINAIIAGLTDKLEDRLTPEENALLDLLSVLIETYDEKHYQIEPAAPHEVLNHLLEARGMRKIDLAPVVGSKGHVYDLCNGKRAISRQMACKLGEFFHVDPGVFI